MTERKVTWLEAAEATNRVMLACKPHLARLNESPLKIIYTNNLPGMMKDVIYYTSVYGIPVEVAMDVMTVYDACRILDTQGWLD